jgi:UDP-glucose 4-epimerase
MTSLHANRSSQTRAPLSSDAAPFNAAGAGPDGELVVRHDPEIHLIPLATDPALGRGQPLKVFASDYPTAEGTASAIHSRLQSCGGTDRGVAPLTLDLGTGKAYSLREVVETLWNG